MDNYGKALAARWRYVLDVQGWSQMDAATRTGKHINSVYGYLTGRSVCGSDVVAILADQVEWLNVDWFVTGRGEPRRGGGQEGPSYAGAEPLAAEQARAELVLLRARLQVLEAELKACRYLLDAKNESLALYKKMFDEK